VVVGSATQGAVLLLLTALPSWTNHNLCTEKAVMVVLMVRFDRGGIEYTFSVSTFAIRQIV